MVSTRSSKSKSKPSGSATMDEEDIADYEVDSGEGSGDDYEEDGRADSEASGGEDIEEDSGDEIDEGSGDDEKDSGDDEKDSGDEMEEGSGDDEKDSGGQSSDQEDIHNRLLPFTYQKPTIASFVAQSTPYSQKQLRDLLQITIPVQTAIMAQIEEFLANGPPPNKAQLQLIYHTEIHGPIGSTCNDLCGILFPPEAVAAVIRDRYDDDEIIRLTGYYMYKTYIASKKSYAQKVQRRLKVVKTAREPGIVMDAVKYNNLMRILTEHNQVLGRIVDEKAETDQRLDNAEDHHRRQEHINADHDAALAGHNAALAVHDATLTGQQATLAEHAAKITGHDVTLAQHGERLADQEAQLAKLKEMQQDVRGTREDMKLLMSMMKQNNSNA